MTFQKGHPYYVKNPNRKKKVEVAIRDIGLVDSSEVKDTPLAKSECEVPALPDIPVLSLPRTIVPGKFFRRNGRAEVPFGDTLSLANLIESRERGATTFTIPPKSQFIRNHGCTACPYWGSSKCPHGIEPPARHTNGVCSSRVNEILDCAIMHKTINGREIKRLEVVEKIRNHIILLESNLVDYKDRKFNKPLSDMTKDEVMFDEYEMAILNQIEKLSTVYASQLQGELEIERLKAKDMKNNPINISPLAIGRLIRESKIVDVPESDILDESPPYVPEDKPDGELSDG